MNKVQVAIALASMLGAPIGRPRRALKYLQGDEMTDADRAAMQKAQDKRERRWRRNKEQSE